MLLDIEKDLKKLLAVEKVRVCLMSTKAGTTKQYLAEVYEMHVGKLLVKTGGGAKGGHRLSAPIRRSVVKHLEAGGTVSLVRV
jgi:DNA-binding IscR family transcriptional regulator